MSIQSMRGSHVSRAPERRGGRYSAAPGNAYAAYAVYDNFNGVDGATLAAHAPDKAPGGAVWTDIDGIWTLQANRANSASAATQGVVWIDSGLADCTITATQINNNSQGIVTNYTDDTHFWLIRIVGTTLTINEFNPTSVTRASGTVAALPQTITVVRAGALLSATVGGVTISYASATLNQAVTKHGFRAGTSGARFEEFTVR